MQEADDAAARQLVERWHVGPHLTQLRHAGVAWVGVGLGLGLELRLGLALG